MYQYVFTDDEIKKTEEKLKGGDKIEMSQTIKDKFKQVDDEYVKYKGDNLYENFSLNKLNFEKPSQEEVTKRAKNSLQNYKNESIEGINQEYETKSANLDEQILSSKQNASEQKNELEKKYSSLKQQASDDAVKRGLARSSIVVNTLEAFDQSMLDNFMSINQQLTKNIDNLNNQKSLLEEQKINALNAFDISYAVELENKITEINENLRKQEQEVLKYNNEIAEKEAEYKQKQLENDRDYVKLMADNGMSGLTYMKNSDKYEIAKEYFLNMDKQQAYSELTGDPEYKEELGYFYNRLLNQILQN